MRDAHDTITWNLGLDWEVSCKSWLRVPLFLKRSKSAAQSGRLRNRRKNLAVRSTHSDCECSSWADAKNRPRLVQPSRHEEKTPDASRGASRLAPQTILSPTQNPKTKTAPWATLLSV